MTCGGKMPIIILCYPQLDRLIEGRVLIKFPGCPPPLVDTHRLIVGTVFTPSITREESSWTLVKTDTLIAFILLDDECWLLLTHDLVKFKDTKGWPFQIKSSLKITSFPTDAKTHLDKSVQVISGRMLWVPLVITIARLLYSTQQTDWLRQTGWSEIKAGASVSPSWIPPVRNLLCRVIQGLHLIGWDLLRLARVLLKSAFINVHLT